MLRKYEVIAFCAGAKTNEGFETGIIFELDDERACQFNIITALMSAGCLADSVTIDDVNVYDEPDGIRIHYAGDDSLMLAVRMV